MKISLIFSEHFGINVPCVCPLQVEETQNQSSNGSGAALHQSDGHSAAADINNSVLRQASSSKEMTSTSTEILGNVDALTLESNNDHKTGLSPSNCQTTVVKTASGSGHPSNLALKMGSYNEEEKQDQSKDEPELKLRQQEGCDCKLCKNVKFSSLFFVLWQ